ncbi:MAG: tyrosine-type recombinase/integrase [Thermomicrobiales bacterium]
MGSRRGHGEGSIYYRQSDRRWVASVDLGYINGKRTRKVRYGKTRKEAAEKLKEALHDQARGLALATREQTVGQFLDTWLTEVVKPSVRSKTFRGYESVVRMHLAPSLGRHRLTKLTPQHVQQMLNAKRASGLSPRSAQYLRDVLRNAIGQALKWGLVSRNVATLVEPPRVKHCEMRFLTPDEARTLFTTARGERLEALYTVALALGLRQGESLGLRWEDVDFAAGTLRIRYALQRIDGTLQLVEPKTSQSRRTLVMPPTVVAALRDHQERQDLERIAAGDRWVETGLVFTTTKGIPLDARNVTGRFKQVLASAGLPDMRWHDLRHSCASLLLAQRVPHRVVMEPLGHSQISLTMSYSHVVPELQAQAALSMERVLGGLDVDRSAPSLATELATNGNLAMEMAGDR